MLNHNLDIVFYDDHLDVKPASVNLSWEMFVGVLCDHEESPCTIEPGPKKCAGKDCPHKARSSIPENPMAWSPVKIKGNRLDENVVSLSLLVLDFDHLTLQEALDIESKLKFY